MDPKPNVNPEEEEAGEAFYNVMPRNISGPSVISKQPAVSSTKSSATPVMENEEISGFSIPHSNRKIVMIVVVVLAIVVLSVFGYFGYKYAKQQNQSNDTNVAVNEDNSDSDRDNDEEIKGDVTTPVEWQKRYFSSEDCQDKTVCADNADPDRDGLNNLEEYNSKTDPNNSDSDSDGLADGDEVHVFGGSPLTDRTNSGEDYKDSDFARGGYDITTNVKFSETQLQEIKDKIKSKGLHQPTIKTLGADALKQYEFTDLSIDMPTDSSDIDSSIDQSPTAKLARDTQRSNTIQKIAAGLLKYKSARGSYPATDSFADMASQVKSYVAVATNYDDPINKDKYVYGYVASNNNQEFTLLYFSETQNLVIKYGSQQAELDQIKNNASANDEKRKRDVENIALALGLYSDSNIDITAPERKVFPTEESYKLSLVPRFMTDIPKDPRTGKDYVYEVSETFDAFTLKAVFDNPPKGYTGYMCNQIECKNY